MLILLWKCQMHWKYNLINRWPLNIFIECEKKKTLQSSTCTTWNTRRKTKQNACTILYIAFSQIKAMLNLSRGILFILLCLCDTKYILWNWAIPKKYNNFLIPNICLNWIELQFRIIESFSNYCEQNTELFKTLQKTVFALLKNRKTNISQTMLLHWFICFCIVAGKAVYSSHSISLHNFIWFICYLHLISFSTACSFL